MILDPGNIDLGGCRAYAFCNKNGDWWCLASDESGVPRDYGPFKSFEDLLEYAVNNRKRFGLYEFEYSI